MNDKPLNVIDLFCGCGGFSYGFRQAGFRILMGIDAWKDATVTYKHNMPEAATMTGNLEEIRSKEILAGLSVDADAVDVIIGGPPCQGFSVSGKRMIDDPRNRLYKSFVAIVEEIQPRMFVMENVPGLIKLFHGRAKAQVIEDFSRIGYHVSVQVLSADDYGVPQHRRRVFFVGIHPKKLRHTEIFPFPLPTHGDDSLWLKPRVTCKDAISDLDFIPDDRSLGEDIPYRIPPQNDYQRWMREGSTSIKNHSATIHTEKTKQIIAMVPDGGNYKDLPQEYWSTRKVHIAWTRMDSRKPCFTIDTGHNHHFHYKENRVPTVRESARIQSFPDRFEFVGIKTSQLKQVGNAVPPMLAQAIAIQVKNVIERG